MIAGCMNEQQAISDYTAKIWKERLNLKSVQIANVEYRLLPENTMVDALDDFVEVYEELLNRHGADPRKTMFTGCSGGGAMPLYTYLYLLQQDQIPLPGLIVAHSPGPGMEWATTILTGNRRMSGSEALTTTRFSSAERQHANGVGNGIRVERYIIRVALE